MICGFLFIYSFCTVHNCTALRPIKDEAIDSKFIFKNPLDFKSTSNCLIIKYFKSVHVVSKFKIVYKYNYYHILKNS